MLVRVALGRQIKDRALCWMAQDALADVKDSSMWAP
jgi:hypothetical protein